MHQVSYLSLCLLKPQSRLWCLIIFVQFSTHNTVHNFSLWYQRWRTGMQVMQEFLQLNQYAAIITDTAQAISERMREAAHVFQGNPSLIC